MNHPSTLTLAAVLGIAAGAAGQAPHDAAWLLNNESNTTTRTAYDRYGQVLVRVRNDHAEGWGYSRDLAANSLRGFLVGSQDVDSSTPDSFWITGYPGQSTGSQPDLQNGWQRGPFPHPLGQSTAILRVTFASQETLPLGRDSYFGMRFPPTPSIDGVRGFFTRYNKLGSLIYDQPGPRYRAAQEPATESVMYVFDEQTLVVSNSALGQVWLVAMIDVPAGVATAVTNQVLQPLSNTAPGLANELSGRNPRVRAGDRDDLPGFLFEDPDAAAGQVAIFLGQPATNLISLDLLFPGAEGAICLDPATMIQVAIKTADANGAASVSIDVPAPVRATIAGTDVHWWGVALTNTLRAIASGRSTQRF